MQSSNKIRATPTFDYTIKVSRRAKSLRLSVRHDGSVTVTKPFFIPEIVARKFVSKHASWIEVKLEQFKKKPIPILAHRSRREYKTYKEKARELVRSRITHWNRLYGYTIKSIRIGNQKSRWGSCSARANLNFNYKVVFLPKEVLDYVIVHELCHLKQLNHSKKFWDLVAEQIPNWKKLRKELKKY